MAKKQQEKKDKGNNKAAPVVHVPRYDKAARTAANKAQKERQRALRVSLEQWVAKVSDDRLRWYFKRHPMGALVFEDGAYVLDERSHAPVWQQAGVNACMRGE